MKLKDHSTYFLCGFFMTKKMYKEDTTLIQHELQKRWNMCKVVIDNEFQEYFNNWNVNEKTFGLE